LTGIRPLTPPINEVAFAFAQNAYSNLKYWFSEPIIICFSDTKMNAILVNCGPNSWPWSASKQPCGNVASTQPNSKFAEFIQ
jgi:hypothetical protein